MGWWGSGIGGMDLRLKRDNVGWRNRPEKQALHTGKYNLGENLSREKRGENGTRRNSNS